MKYLVLLGDGMADFPLESLGGETPLSAARTPAMDSAAREGVLGLFSPIPEGFAAGSDIGNLSVFGYDPAKYFTGRAPLEARNQDIPLGENEIAFRCNLVALGDSTMEDFTAGHIATEDARELIEALNTALGNSETRFYAGVSYRHLCVLRCTGDEIEALVRVRCTPPHDITGQAFAEYLPEGEHAERIRRLMEGARNVLAGHAVNTRRAAEGHAQANSIWLWGQGRAPSLPTYRDRFGLNGAVISAVDLVNGIGRCAGLEVIRVPGATGYVDTDYEAKIAHALDALTPVDFVYLHVEAPDEAAHEGDADLKIRAIEDFDRRVVAPAVDYARASECRILIAPDHVTSIASRTHAPGPVPFAVFGTGVSPNGGTAYSEVAAASQGELFARGYELTPRMLDPAPFSLERLANASVLHS